MFSRAFVALCWLLIPKNVALRHSVSARLPTEVKNNNCLFVRLFKVKKNGVFLLGIFIFVLGIFRFLYYANKGISIYVLDIFRFLYYANKGSDDTIDRCTETIKY